MAGRSKKDFGKELRWHRVRAGVSQVELGSMVLASGQSISAWETGRYTPDKSLVVQIDDKLGAGGALVQAWDELKDTRDIPQSWRKYDAVERDASSISEFRGDVVPGLLQTREYARAIMSNVGRWKGDDLEKLVEARVSRLGNLNDCELSFLLDEHTVARIVGSRDIQSKQIEQIVELVEARRVRLALIPDYCPSHPNPTGPFRLMTLRDGRLVGHEDHRSGLNVVTGQGAHRLLAIYNALQYEALPVGQTLELLEKVRKKVNG